MNLCALSLDYSQDKIIPMYPRRGYSDFTENLQKLKKKFGTLLVRQSSVNALINNRIL